MKPNVSLQRGSRSHRRFRSRPRGMFDIEALPISLSSPFQCSER
jgi:hypothetical protein